MAPVLRAMGRFTVGDRMALAAYCQAAAELAESTKILEAEGRIIDGDPPTLHPAVALQKAAYRHIKTFLVEFGLSPSARARLRTPETAPAVDPLQELTLRVHAQ